MLRAFYEYIGTNDRLTALIGHLAENCVFFVFYSSGFGVVWLVCIMCFCLVYCDYTIMDRVSQSAVLQTFIKYIGNWLVLYAQIFNTYILCVVCAVDEGKVSLFLDFP